MSGRAARGAVIVAVAAAAGCFSPEGGHGLRFDLVRETPASTVTETKSFFLWGLLPTRHVDVLDKCPHGAVAISERTAATAAAVPTLGLWSWRTVTYHCRGAPPADGGR